MGVWLRGRGLLRSGKLKLVCAGSGLGKDSFAPLLVLQFAANVIGDGECCCGRRGRGVADVEYAAVADDVEVVQ